MGRVVSLTGIFQFPVCAAFQYLAFSLIESAGISLGSGPYAVTYCCIACAMSSTMVNMKQLAESGETERPNGRLTIGILMFQDLFAAIFLAIQPRFTNLSPAVVAKSFGMMVVLSLISLSFSFFIMPAVLRNAHKSVELMMVLSLSWVFFICITAHLPSFGVGISVWPNRVIQITTSNGKTISNSPQTTK
ncbi:unnamed protein product [Polarella glacialis]|uniref:Cation/H+ exchanger transmembrane domain-containing protein n=1 Tax=Polarella glacialis TaxID=89957 RepID=A0A813DU28_POLGL|nr:unnamed protein product [Polarella glacialis]